MNYRETGNFYEEQEVNEVVQRYENMLLSGAATYFDVCQIEQVIERYVEEGRFDAALEATETGLEQHPTSMVLKIRKTNVLFNLGEIAVSLKLANELLQIEKTNPDLFLVKGSALLLKGKTKEAAEAFNQALSFSPDERDETLFNIGYSYEQSKKYEKAIMYLEEALLENPQHEGAIYELAYCYEKTDQDEKSLVYYNRYIDLDTFSDSAWFNLGIVFTKLNRIEESIEAYEYAIVINEDFANAWYNLGHSHMLLKEFNQAVDAFNYYLKYDEKCDEVYTLIANCYTRMRQSEPAIMHYGQAIQLNEKNDRAWFGYALEMYKQKNYKRAYECAIKATQHNEKIIDYFFSLAKTASKLNYLNEAVDAYEKTIELELTRKTTWLSYAQMLYKRGMVVRAIELLEASLAYFPGNPLILYRLAAYYLDINDEETAVLFLQMALKADKTKVVYLYKTYPEALQIASIRKLISKYKL